ncbi:hypothetical protein Tco_0747773 [Tanacetum coccineum]|uniref:Reverse transcriptase domain-containing protein n=1 Tax=Tanacetum coccineum TaxID=301880 RepID=A0ABQ4YWF4_9ASTR
MHPIYDKLNFMKNLRIMDREVKREGRCCGLPEAESYSDCQVRWRLQERVRPKLERTKASLTWKNERHASGHVFRPGPVWGCDRLVSRAKVIENQVMAISVISVSSDSSEDSVGTPAGRVILFGTIPTTIPDTTPVITPPTTQTDTTVIPTETPIIAPTIPPSPDYTPASPDYSPASDSESDPSEDPSSDHIPPLPATSPFLSSNDDTTDSDTPDTPPLPTYGKCLAPIIGATMTVEEFEELVARRVAEELEAREAARTLEPLNENGDELEGENGGNGNGNGGNGNGNGGNGGNGNGGNGNRNGNHEWFPDEEDRVERFIGGLPDNIQGNVIAANPARLQDAIRIANQLWSKSPGYAAKKAENNKGMESNLGITVTATASSRGKILVGKCIVGCSCSKHSRLQLEISRNLCYDMEDQDPFQEGFVLKLRNQTVKPTKKTRMETSPGNQTEHKTQKYIEKGCQVLSGASYIQKADDKNGGDATEKVPTSTRISRIVPRHLPGLPPTRKLMNRLAIPLDEIQVDDKLNFIEEPVEIMDHEDKRLKQIRIPIVKEPVDLQDGP